MNDIANNTEEFNADDERQKSTLAVSLCFWFALLTATAVYGSVVLAPKLAVWSEVRSEFDSNVRQLVSLEEDIEYLERVEVALQTDPEFLQRLVGTSGHNATDTEEFIPVSGSLLFGQSDEEPTTAKPTDSLLSDSVRLVATNTQLRSVMLWFAACLTVFAFAFLNDAGSNFVHATAAFVQSAALVPMKRYTRQGSRQETASASADKAEAKDAASIELLPAVQKEPLSANETDESHT